MTEKKQEFQMDAERAKQVPVVLRVKFARLIGGQKYSWDEVKVLSTLKNDSKHSFSGLLQIAHYDWEPGVPSSECTVYLTPFVEGDESRWKLLEGTGKVGVSHVANK